MKIRLIVLTACLLLLFTTSCTASDIEEIPTASIGSTPTRQPTETEEPTQVPSSSQADVFASEGPFLLIQTDFATYQMIDFDLGTITPFTLPESDETYNLAGGLSPGGKLMLLPVSADEVQIMELSTENIFTTYEFNLDSTSNGFRPEQAVEAALEAAPDLSYPTDTVQSMVESAYAESLLNVQWYQDDAHVLFVLPGSGTSTQLYLDDLQTGERIQLEDLPGFVQDYWINAAGDAILLKKGYIFEANIWQDDRYYLIDLTSGETKLISLPDDAENPSLTWMGLQTISITHQTGATASVGYSLLDAATLETQQLIEGSFSSICVYADGLLLLLQDQTERSTTLSLLDLTGQTLQTTNLDGLCSLKAVVDEKLILNCEMESLIVDADLQAYGFGDPVSLLSSAPDNTAYILVARTGTVSLLNDSLEIDRDLALDGTPLEIRWLPDSSGFVYRTLGELHYYDLSVGEDKSLLTSDLYNDYTNINAVWINDE